MIYYLIKTILCSAFFLLIYKIVLERGKSYKFNRFYLLSSLLLSFIIPGLSIPVKTLPAANTISFAPVLQETEEIIVSVFQSETYEMQSSYNPSSYNPLFIIYLLITGLLVYRTFRHLFRLRKTITQAEKQKHDEAVLVFSDNRSYPYTFLKYIFIQHDKILPEEIIRHEMAHVKQKHTLDIFFIELLINFFWFNPALLLYRKYITLNHEYLADESVLKTCPEIKKYLNVLLSICSRESDAILLHQFNNYPTIKKRVKMIMKKSSAKTVQWLRFCSIAPLCAMSLFLFSGNSYVKAESLLQQENAQQEEIQQEESQIAKPQQEKSRQENKPYLIMSLDISDVKSAQKNIEKYDSLIKKLTDKDDTFLPRYKEFMQIIEKHVTKKDGKTTINLEFGVESDLSKADQNRMREIFLSMTPEQQKALPLAFERRTVPKKKVPTAEDYESWKDPAGYGLWINGKRVDNSELNKYKHSDFSSYSVSKLYSNAKDYGKYVYHLDLKTNSEFEAYIAEMEADETLYPKSSYNHAGIIKVALQNDSKALGFVISW